MKAQKPVGLDRRALESLEDEYLDEEARGEESRLRSRVRKRVVHSIYNRPRTK